MQHSNCHRELTNGVGKCGVPMWMDGLPAGFCDEPAYGKQEPDQERYGNWGAGWRGGRWYPGGVFTPGYSSALTCYQHGGPKGPIQQEVEK